MCNCGKKRGGGGAVPVGGGCVGPGCARAVVRAIPLDVTPTPAPMPAIRARAAPRVFVTPVLPVAAPPPVTGDDLPIVDPVLWGPHLWRFLHIAAQHCIPSVSRKSIWDQMLGVLTTGLPCPECREHYTAWLTANPLLADESTGLPGPVQEWILAIHNQVNQRKGVAEWTPEQCVAAYRIADPIERNNAMMAALTAARDAGVATTVYTTGTRLMMRGVE